MKTIPAAGYAAHEAGGALEPFTFVRREPGPLDVEIEILFCGVCHSDLHTARGEWGGSVYPVVPGHEIVGHVSRAGAGVTRFRPGDPVAVGCMVDSCRTCPSCRDGLEQYCENGAVYTYNSPDTVLGGTTCGGYSNRIVVTEAFVLRLPPAMDPAAAAPLLCAGITTWSPLRTWETGPGARVGVVGLGGLGHMAVKLASAMGADVVLFTTSPGKADDALRLGASEVVVSRDRAAMKRQRARLDFVLDTVAVPHDLNPYLDALRRDGTLCLVGIPPEPHPAPGVGRLVNQRRRLAGSSIGGIAETQEMLDFCAAHGLTADIELIPIQQINEAYERMLRSDVRYRFVIDMESLTGG
ncbi:MAG TPA: NAD(P)-dependent alcohol dehydrogenase [Gemmatimonadales bacterium]|nr:NAD(P)-dependent alcohol dehydrogenase [Gemmatimonadales bacterium]